VGNPNCSYRHPRKDVVSMLLTKSNDADTACSLVKPLEYVFQTDKGSEKCSNETVGRETYNSCIISGDIVVSTDGNSEYSIKTSGMLWVNGRKQKKVKSQIFVMKMDGKKDS